MAPENTEYLTRLIDKIKIDDIAESKEDYEVNQVDFLNESTSQEDLEAGCRSLMMSFLTQFAFGTDLNRVNFPAVVIEPRSMLERVTDCMCHPHLVYETALKEDNVDRFIDIVRNFIAGWHIQPHGVKKPFNPILGEVFRCYWPDEDQIQLSPNQSSNTENPIEKQNTECVIPKTTVKCKLEPILNYHQNIFEGKTRASKIGTFCVTEQVSHHPPMSAFFFANPKRQLVATGCFRMRPRFLGTTISVGMEGETRIYLNNHPGEEYIITNPNMYIRGLFIGPVVMEIGDTGTISCSKNDLIADISFITSRFFSSSKAPNALKGTIRVKSTGKILYNIRGNWTGIVHIDKVIDGQAGKIENTSVLFDANNEKIIHKMVRCKEKQDPNESQQVWYRVSEAIREKNFSKAATEKHLVEETQRIMARKRQETGVKWSPKHFSMDNQGFWGLLTRQELLEGDPKSIRDKINAIIEDHFTGEIKS